MNRGNHQRGEAEYPYNSADIPSEWSQYPQPVELPKPLSYSVDVVEDRSYIRVTMKGEITNENVIPVHDVIRTTLNESGIKLLLVDVREATNVTSITEQYEFGKRIMSDKIGFPKDGRSVILSRPEDTSHDMVVNASRRHGYDVHLSKDEANAIRWLKRGE